MYYVTVAVFMIQLLNFAALSVIVLVKKLTNDPDIKNVLETASSIVINWLNALMIYVFAYYLGRLKLAQI